ncbi:MAG: SDR family oxidoreductase [Nitrosospira sp.]|nr:SDR family oxidoreductase [Nitrosospira sp.]
MTTFFITGATGVLGSAIVRELLANSSHRLVLLIRANDDSALRKRVEQLLAFLEVDPVVTRTRIEPVLGDTELARFGLSSHDYAMLGASVTHIIHSAAIVRMNLPLDIARRAAVAATENVLQLARICQANGILKKVEMVSTVGVGGRWRGPLPEKWINEPRSFHNTYEQAKAEAEAVMEQQQTNDELPMTVHRPSMIVGNSHNGSIPHFQIFYYLIEFLSGRRTFGFLPDLSQNHLDLAPADYVAQAIVWSSSSPLTIGRILHLCAGPDQAISLDMLRTIVLAKFCARGLSVPGKRTLPADWFNTFVRMAVPFAPNRLKGTLRTLPIFLDYLSEDQVFANVHTRQLLEPAGLVLPHVDVFLDQVLSYYLNQTYPGRG